MNKDLKIIILFFTGIFFFTCYMFSDSVLTADDTCFSFLYSGIKFIKTLYYGSWLMWIMNTLFYVIPYKLNINLQDWCLFFGSLFKAGIISALFIYIYKILRKNSNSIKISFVASLLLYILFFILHFTCGFIDFIVNENFFKFVIPAFLFVVFLYYFYSFLYEEKVNENVLFIYSLLLSSSSEAVGIISIVFVVTIFYLEKQKKCKPILTMLILGLFCLILSKGFQLFIHEKFSFDYFKLNYLIEFIVIYLKNILLLYFPIYLFIAGLVYKNYKEEILPLKQELEKEKSEEKTTVKDAEKNKKIEETNRNIIQKKSKINFALAILFSTFIYFLILFIFGKNFYDGNFLLEYKNLYSFLIISIIATIAFLLKNISKKAYKIFIIILIIPFIFSVIYLRNTLINIKTFSYARDKIRMFYEYKNKTPIMPNFARYYMYISVSGLKRIKIDSKYHIKENKEMDEEIKKLTNKDYYNIIYGAQNRDWIIKGDAVEEFKNNGGNFNELKKIHYSFNKLKDKKFVLNKQQK